MATDYAEMERQFLAGLEADTGRDLAQWMAAIDAQRLAHRNDIIDWLRQQGFQFSWASWLERIHHNGGRPIYEAKLGAVPFSAPGAADERQSPRKMEPSPISPPPAELDALLAKAKAYRPLAEHLMREVRRTLPDVTISARGVILSFARPAELAALVVGSRELRLGLDLGPDADEALLPRGRLPGATAQVSHVLVLTDARQVTPALIEAVKQSDRRVNGG